MIFLALAAMTQPAATPDLSRSRWYFVGRSEQVAHYIDEASVTRNGSSATAVIRMVYFDRSADRSYNAFRAAIDCTNRFYVRRDFYRVEGTRVRGWSEPVTLAGVRVPASIYPMAATAIARACDGDGGDWVVDPELDARLRLPPAPTRPLSGGAPAPPGPPARMPRPAAPTRPISNADYPAEALRARAQGRVVMRLNVGTDGRVQACAVTRSSGSAVLDEASCRFMTERARFVPAADQEGRPIAWTVSQGMAWTLPNP